MNPPRLTEIPVVFYCTSGGAEPVLEWLRSLPAEDRRAVEEAGLEENIQHLGYIEQADLQVIYHLAAVLVMPSLFESVSIPIYEALQAGTPVAASNILSFPEQVGEAGVLFDPFSSSSIAESILKLVNDTELAKALGKKGREKMAAMTPQRYCNQLQDLLGALSKGKAS